MVALESAETAEAQRLIARLEGIPCYMKVGMQLFYASGPAFIRELKEGGYHVFLDVKMHDIPNTVMGGANSIAKLGVDMFNVHAAGGKKMMQSAIAGVEAACAANPSLPRPVIIAVTQLTSTNNVIMNDEVGIPGSVEATVVRYAKLSHEAGLDGVVASPYEVTSIKAACGDSFCTVTPGIRPMGAPLQEQCRVMTPAQAMQHGTDYIVVGRPITQAHDPRAALLSIIEELV
jgi:orotidine-5'-phosphate decarboxylase